MQAQLHRVSPRQCSQKTLLAAEPGLCLPSSSPIPCSLDGCGSLHLVPHAWDKGKCDKSRRLCSLTPSSAAARAISPPPPRPSAQGAAQGSLHGSQLVLTMLLRMCRSAAASWLCSGHML